MPKMYESDGTTATSHGERSVDDLYRAVSTKLADMVDLPGFSFRPVNLAHSIRRINTGTAFGSQHEPSTFDEWVDAVVEDVVCQIITSYAIAPKDVIDRRGDGTQQADK